MHEIDARGIACPQPVILTRKTCLEFPGEPLCIRVDNVAARDNVNKLAQGLGYAAEVREFAGEYEIVLTPSKINAPEQKKTERPLSLEQRLGLLATGGCECPPNTDRGTVMLIKSQVLGEGDEELGVALMKSFLYSLCELSEDVTALIFMHRGVYLTCAGSEVLSHLEHLTGAGIEIYACGTCLDFFHLQDKLKIGTVSNMYSILEIMKQAGKVITI